MMRFRLSASLLAPCALASCQAEAPPVQLPPPEPMPTPSPTTSPTPTPIPTPVPTPTPAPTPTPVYDHWLDAPQSPGDWFYVSRPPYSFAAFGKSATEFDFVMRCDRPNRVVSLGRVSAQKTAQPMQVLTETSSRLFNAEPRQGSIETLLGTDLPAANSFLDAMAISKGRFAVEVGGERTLYIPSWPEVTRVIEDCR